jgi:hypothetical protein
MTLCANACRTPIICKEVLCRKQRRSKHAFSEKVRARWIGKPTHTSAYLGDKTFDERRRMNVSTLAYAPKGSFV